MNTTMNGGVDPALERKRRRKEIMNDKRLNIWQKKFLLEELDAEQSKPAPAPLKPSLPPQGNTAPKIKPAPSPAPNPRLAPAPSPRPKPAPTPAPTPAPSRTPPPQPARQDPPKREPAQPRWPLYTDDTVAAPEESIDERMRKYAAERASVANSSIIMHSEDGKTLDDIDRKYGLNQEQYQKWRVMDVNRTKLKLKADEVNRLRKGADSLLAIALTTRWRTTPAGSGSGC